MEPVVNSDTPMEEVEGLDEKAGAAIITPEESPAEDAEPAADEFDAIKNKHMPLLPDLEVEAEGHNTWKIKGYRSLPKREHGPVFEVGGQPWRILVFPHGNNVDFASFYLEHGYGEKIPENWYACVQFALVLWNVNDPTMYVQHTATHRFNADEGDWGFTRFSELRKLFNPHWDGTRDRPLIEEGEVNITAYVRIYKDPTGVLWHNFTNYDSKKETGMVGLKNLGATCYLNSLLQSLYFTNAFRKAVYQIPTGNDTERTNAWALQRLFHLLETSEGAVSTNELTTSFGWETRHIFEQQDVQELSRLLMERLEERMKGTEAENALAKMFVGKMKTYISCINVPKESSRIEDYWDIQLNVSGNKNLDESFKDYIQVETLDGDNKYYAEEYGLQAAKKGVIFESFPTVLHLQLKRFEYDVNKDAMMKVNDRYEFPEVFDASPYLSDDADKSEPYLYNLHGVLVHSGDFNAGHYYAFLKPTRDGHFYKFDDDRVTRATLKEALEENFGGEFTNSNQMRNPYTQRMSNKRSMSAYMLVYIRQSRLDTVLSPVPADATPEHIAVQLKEEAAVEAKRKKERDEQHLYLACGVVTERHFKHYQGFDLASWDMDQNSKAAPDYYKIPRVSTIEGFANKMVQEYMVDGQVRFWVLVNRQNKTFRPDQPLIDLKQTIEEAYIKHASKDRPFRLWAEFSETKESMWPEVQSAGAANPFVLVFLKHFDHEAQTLMGVGHVYIRRQSKVSELVPMIKQKMGWGDDAPTLALYEEIKHSMIEPMKGKFTLQQAEIQDGDIVCFQKALSDSEALALQQAGKYTTAKEFYDYLLNRITVRFIPRVPKSAEDPSSETFDLELNRKMSYDQLAAKVGQHLKTDPGFLRFAVINSQTLKPKAFLRRNNNQNLYSVLNPQFSALQHLNHSLFYEVLEMSLSEYEQKRVMGVTWIKVADGQLREEVVEVLVPKAGTVEDIRADLKKKAGLDDETVAKMRMFQCHNNKIQKELTPELPTIGIPEYSRLFAEVPPEEPGDDDIVARGFHFDKDPSKPHGIPFTFVLKPKETLKEAKERLSKRIGVKGRPFDNIKVACVAKSQYAKALYIEDDDILYDTIGEDFLIGLDHVNKKAPSMRSDFIFIRVSGDDA